MHFFIVINVFFLIILTIIVNKNITTGFDEKVLRWFDSIESLTLNSFFILITWLGSLWILLPTVAGITTGLLFYGYRMAAIVFNIGFIGAVSTTYIMKSLIERPRPELFENMTTMPYDSSYPSAHTTQAFAFALMLSLLVYSLDTSFKTSFASLFLSFAVMVGISRMYLQVHFPSDVIAGVLVASIWTGIVIYLINSGVLR
ncbi:phosphatidic acid phosphatase type 2/haloperoxidase [Desulfoluna spongiiphila]|nr:phosphatidic acid phosphatase type 2/haloperoxidase [Desulfoluna spongiiphila]